MSIPLSAQEYRTQLADKKQDNERLDIERKTSFLKALADDSFAFEITLTDWILSKLHLMSTVMLVDTAAFPFPLKLSDKFRNRFRVSTLVSMYRMTDPTVFEDIGYAKGQSPFQRVKDKFVEKGILVENVSDSSKGVGFWLSLSFANEHFV